MGVITSESLKFLLETKMISLCQLVPDTISVYRAQKWPELDPTIINGPEFGKNRIFRERKEATAVKSSSRVQHPTQIETW